MIPSLSQDLPLLSNYVYLNLTFNPTETIKKKIFKKKKTSLKCMKNQ